MSAPVLPTEYSLRSYALKYEVSARTIIRAIKGEAIRGERANRSAHAAAAEWRENQRTHVVKPIPPPFPIKDTKQARKRARAK